MGVLWKDEQPKVLAVPENGYVETTLLTRVEGTKRSVRQSLLLQVTAPKKQARDLGANNKIKTDQIEVIKWANTCLPDNEPNDYQYGLKEMKSLSNVIVIPQSKFESFLNSKIVSPCLSLQTKCTVVRKIEVRLFTSKKLSNVQNNGTLSSIREYARYKFICSNAVFGALDEKVKPVAGAITINQYPLTPTEVTSNENLTRQQDKPGRFFIRGCGVSAEDALRSKAIEGLESFLHKGSEIETGCGVFLTPVIDVMDDLWTVRCAQSSGYQRVAAQKAVDPAAPLVNVGGP